MLLNSTGSQRKANKQGHLYKCCSHAEVFGLECCGKQFSPEHVRGPCLFGQKKTSKIGKAPTWLVRGWIKEFGSALVKIWSQS